VTLRKPAHVPGARNGGRPTGPEEPTLSTSVRVWKVNKVNSKRAPYQTVGRSREGEDCQFRYRGAR
jgi:hypothetical protein